MPAVSGKSVTTVNAGGRQSLRRICPRSLEKEFTAPSGTSSWRSVRRSAFRRYATEPAKVPQQSLRKIVLPTSPILHLKSGDSGEMALVVGHEDATKRDRVARNHR